MMENSPRRPVSTGTLGSLARALDPGRAGRLLLLAGPPLVLDLGASLAGPVLLRGRKVLFVDGANTFNPYILTRLADQAGQEPRAVLERLMISRTFTVHQLEALVCDHLLRAIDRHDPGLVVLSGWSTLFHDENVPQAEAMRLLQSTADAARRLAASGAPILGTHAEEPRTARLAPLRGVLARAATAVARLDRDEGIVRISLEKPGTLAGFRPLQIPEDRLLPIVGKGPHDVGPAMHPW